MTRADILEYAEDRYGTLPDYPFARYPEYAVLRRRDGKWYAVLLTVAKNQLGLEGDTPIEILNVKCDPVLAGSLRTREEVFPAYHMNKEHWISILMDSPFPKEEVYSLMDWSYHSR